MPSATHSEANERATPRPDKGKAPERTSTPSARPTPARAPSSLERLLAELTERYGTPKSYPGRSSSAARERVVADLNDLPGPTESPAGSTEDSTGTARPAPTRSHSSRDRLFSEINRLEEILAREGAESSLSVALQVREQELKRLRADLASERRRADAAEKRSNDAKARALAHAQAEQELEQRRAQTAESLRAFRDELATAHEQLRVAQREIDRLAAEKNEAEEMAARARTTARLAADMLKAAQARDEGVRAGMEEARAEWERIFVQHAQDAQDAAQDAEDELPVIPSEAHSVRTARTQRRQSSVRDMDTQSERDTVELLRTRLHDAFRGNQTPGPGARPIATDRFGRNMTAEQEDALDEQMSRRTDARIELLFPPGPLGITSCIWHNRRPDAHPFPARMAPEGALNCGCSIEEGLFEESLLRNGVGRMLQGQTNLDADLRKPLLELLQKRYDYRDGDFEVNPETGAWVAGEGPQVWENGL